MQPNRFDSKNRPLRVLVAVRESCERNRLMAAVRRSSRLEAKSVMDLGAVGREEIQRTDVLIIQYELLENLRDRNANVFIEFSRRARIIIVLPAKKMHEAASVLRLGDAWLFTDQKFDHLEAVIELSKLGYTVMPADLLATFNLEETREKILETLSENERRVLHELGSGMTNRNIAEQLGITEAQAKAIIRTILRMMRFNNRTEAGVFVARIRGKKEERSTGGRKGRR